MRAEYEMHVREEEAKARRKQEEDAKERLKGQLAREKRRAELRAQQEAEEKEKTELFLEKERAARAELEQTLAHVRSAEKALRLAQEALGRGDVMGAAEMRATAAREFELGGKDRQYSNVLKDLGNEIRTVAEDQMYEQQQGETVLE